MSKSNNKALALLMATLLAVSAALPIYADETAETVETPAETTEISVIEEPQEIKYTYEIAGLGTVTAASKKVLGASADYYNFACEQDGVKQNAHVITATASRGALLLGVTLGEKFGTRAKITSLTDDAESENRLVAAVNADFFSTATGVPMGVFVNEGRFVSSSSGRAAIGITADGEVFIGDVGDSISMTHNGKELPVSYLNKYPTVYGAYLLTRDFGETTRLSETVAATEYIIELDDDIEFGKRIRGKVKEICTATANGEIPEGCAVIVVPDAFSGREAYEVLDRNDRVYIEVNASEQFENVWNAIGGGDIILKDGELTDHLEDEVIETARNPRTACGVTADGEIVLLVVDGRNKTHSSGVKMTSLAETMKALGAVSAINLDGGGSSLMVHFGTEGADIVNKPSDGVERKVPNALVLYENRSRAEEFSRLDLSAEADLIFAGASVPLSLALSRGTGEAVEFEFNEENTVFALDELFGSVEFVDGVPYFTAAEADGVGIIRVQTEIGGESVSAELFLTVTSVIDTLTADQSIILSDVDGAEKLNVTAKLYDREVYFGDMLSVMCDNEDFVLYVDKNAVNISLYDMFEPEIDTEISVDEIIFDTPDFFEETVETTVETEETAAPEEILLPESAHGTVEISLGDKNVVIPVYFDSALTLDIGEFLMDKLFVENEGYTLHFDGEGGVKGMGAFVIESPEPVVETTAEVAETTDVPEETTAETVETTAETIETTAETVETTAETVETTAPEETTAETVETSTAEETTVPEETTAPEPEPFDVKLSVNDGALVSNGLSGRRIWLWAEGLSEDSNPYAVFEKTAADGEKEEITVYYDKYYDFLDFNGRALLTISPEIGEGSAALKTLLGYTTLDEEQSVSVGPAVFAEALDTNLYTDTAEHWSNYYVNMLSYMEIVNGSENLRGEMVYSPDSGLSREQFAKVLVNYLKINPDDYAESELPFTDTAEIADWAIPYVRAAVGAGLMRGRLTLEDTLIFAPKDGIKRQEALHVLGGLLGDTEGVPLEFADSDTVAPWAVENLEKSLAASLISGYDDGTLRPEGGITRAEAATVVVRLFEFSSKS